MCGAAVAVTVVAAWPVTTRYGVDYQVSTRRMTLFEKAVDFLSRDLQGRRIARDVVGDAADPEARLIRIFTWTIAHVQPAPSGFPVVDDHVLHIMIRGYGAPDQQAEVLALLASYSGFRATGMHLQAPSSRAGIDVTVVRLGRRMIICDVEHRLLFRDATGRLADVDALLNHSEWIAASAGALVVGGVPYARHLETLRNARISFSRMEAQRVWPRLRQIMFGWMGTRS